MELLRTDLINIIKKSKNAKVSVIIRKTPGDNRGIKHDFPFIIIRKVPREVLKTEGKLPEGPCEC